MYVPVCRQRQATPINVFNPDVENPTLPVKLLRDRLETFIYEGAHSRLISIRLLPTARPDVSLEPYCEQFYTFFWFWNGNFCGGEGLVIFKQIVRFAK